MLESTDSREALLVHYWYVLKKRRRTVAVFTTVLTITVAIGTMLSPKYYSSEATIEISPKAPVVLEVDEVNELVSASNTLQMRTYYGTQYRIIRSRSVLDEALKILREEHGVTSFDEAEDPIAALRRRLTVEPDAETHLVDIVVEHTDPDHAALFANTVAEAYIALNLERSLAPAQQALEWLAAQQEIYHTRKTESDGKVHAFLWENDLLGLQEGRSTTQEALVALQKAWSGIHTERIQVEAGFRELVRLQNSGELQALANYLTASNATLAGIISRYLQLREQEANLRGRYLPDHPEMRQLQAERLRLEETVQAQIDDIIRAKRAELKMVSAKEKALEGDISRVTEELEQLEEKLIELEFIEGEADRNEEFYKNLDQRISEVDLSQFIRANNIRFMDRAIPDEIPVRPKLMVNMAMGLILGLFGGCALAFLMEYLDSTVKSREDVETAIGMPFLGIVPLIADQDRKSLTSERDRNIFVHAVPRSNVAEALRSIRTNLLFAGHSKMDRLLITSALPQEGKSFITSNLSVLIAMTGSKALVIDADLRRPALHKLFELPNTRGLSTFLAGVEEARTCIRPSHVPGLDVMCAGPTPPNPAELLGNGMLPRFLDSLEEYDIVLIDSPPAGVVADPLMLSSLVDGVLVVIEANQTSRNVVTRARDLLAEVNAKMLGAIVNKLDIRSAGYGYYYYYDYGYYGESERPEKSKAS